MKRRKFLKLTGGYAGLAGISSLSFPLSLFAEQSKEFTDYKAMVVVLQHGGNDSINTFIPSGSDLKKGYANYANIRGSLAVSNKDLSKALTFKEDKLFLTSNPYAQNSSVQKMYTSGFYQHKNIDGLSTNGLMPEFAHLVNANKVAIVSNTGTLVEPTKKEAFKKGTVSTPPYLYAHDNQRKLAFNGFSSSLSHEGWAGLPADNWSNVNSGSVYGLNISLHGTTHLFSGLQAKPIVLNSTGPVPYYSIRRSLSDSWLKLKQYNENKKLYQTMRQDSFLMQDTLVKDWKKSSLKFKSTNAYGEEIFSLPTKQQTKITCQGSLLQQLSSVAKLIKIGKERGLKRQIFYVVHGGYDTHGNQALTHARLLRELSMGVGDFQLAMEELGMEDEVTTFNLSDFGRSLGNNGDGTDHAWGAHHFVVGGAVKGGLYGTLPDLTLGGEDDASNKGRLIPTTSLSQYLGTMVKWFGADESLLNKLFPERKNFSQKDLGFMG